MATARGNRRRCVAAPSGSRGGRRLLVALAWLGSVAAAQASPALPPRSIDAYVGRPVGRLEVALAGTPAPAPELLALIDTQPGRPFAMADVRASIVRLMALQRFDDVRVSASPAGDAVDLLYDCIPRRLVSEVVFRGPLGLDESSLRRAVTERYGRSPSPGRAPDIAAMLETLYRDRGYTRASVKPEVAPLAEPTESALVLTVQSGPRARYGRLLVDGDMGVSQPSLLARLRLRPGGPYDPAALDQAVTRYVDGLRARGFYEARLQAGATVSADGRTADVTLAGERGPHMTFVFRGSPLPRGRTDEFLAGREEGSVDEDLLEDAGARIEQYLQGQGYADAKAPHRRVQAGDGEVQIVFDVDRGPLFRIRSVAPGENPPAMPADLGLEPGAPFVASRLSTYLGVVALAYRERGYDGVKVDGRTTRSPASAGLVLVDVEIVIAPGTQRRIGSVVFDVERAAAAVTPGVTEADLRAAAGALEGQPFYEPRVKASTDALVSLYLQRGHQDATAEWQQVPEGPSTVGLRFRIYEGPRFLVDRILITGNLRTSLRTIERELTLQPGAPLDLDRVYESQQRLSELGLFRRVQVTPLVGGTDNRRDVLVTLEEAPVTTLGYGVGLEGGRRLRGEIGPGGQALESFDVSPSGSFEIGRRNLWGKNRSVTFFTRVGIRKRDVVTTAEGVGDTTGFREYRVLGSYREPRVLGAGADFVLSGYREQAARSAFNFNRLAVRAELVHRLSTRVSTNIRYQLEETRLFNQRIDPADRPTVDRVFPQVRVGSVSSSIIRSTRDDELNPSSGTLFSLDGKLAATALGSEVGFVKSYAQIYWFHRLPGARRLVFASGARLGLAAGFARFAPGRDADDNIIVGSDGEPVIVRVDDLPASERFFAGGDTTVRGFGQDRLGAPDTLTSSGVPKGGNAVIILNGELRATLTRRIEGVAFLDLGNVFSKVGAIDLGSLRPGGGFGVRVNSPVGPVRADVGFRLDRQRFSGGTAERSIQFYIGVGHAF